MTYSKIYVPSVPDRIKENENTVKASADKIHRPEIVITESSDNIGYRRNYSPGRRSLLPSVSTVLTVAALCFASFIIGCSVTDNALSSAIIRITSATYGKIPEQSETAETSSENSATTFYNKYMPSDSSTAASGIHLDYLAATPYVFPDSNSQPDKDIQVDTSSGGKFGADGEILYPVIAKDLSCTDIHTLSNQTSYKPDTSRLLSQTPAALKSLSVNPGEPLVLILHTHGTESFNTCGRDGYYSSANPVRSENIAENMISIGEKLASVLENFGIPVIHSTKMCDKDSFVHAYSTSANEAKAYLDKYPSIRFVIDLHRDSIEASDKTKTKPVFSLAGQNVAQLMFVVGTNAAGAKHPDWKENLSLALTLQSEMSADYPKLFRRINLRTASFNQQLSCGYMLLECGSCANTRKEAEAAAEIFATGFARVIKKYAV